MCPVRHQHRLGVAKLRMPCAGLRCRRWLDRYPARCIIGLITCPFKHVVFRTVPRSRHVLLSQARAESAVVLAQLAALGYK
jgi:hypothetical protein